MATKKQNIYNNKTPQGFQLGYSYNKTTPSKGTLGTSTASKSNNTKSNNTKNTATYNELIGPK